MPATTRDPWAAWLTGAIAAAFALRAAAAFVVETLARRAGGLCLFDDTRIYWHLAGTILRREPFAVMQYNQPHQALRTPGYPLFLATCRALFGDSTLAPRLLQAALAAAAIGLLALLVTRLGENSSDPARWRRAAIWTAWLAALEPLSAGMSVLLLSEGLFAPLLIAGLWSLATAFSSPAHAALAGGIQGTLIMVRPSWALFPLIAVPLLMLHHTRPRAALTAVLLVAGATAVMAPWWVRNARVYDAFVPTSLWLGASLYDGLSPSANGASDMRFLDDPFIRSLDERTQDRWLRDQALAFARTQPVRAAQLALVKLGRFFSPWPNAEMLRSPALAVATTLVVLPVYLLTLLGAWHCRHHGRALLLLAGPLIYTALLHTAFVSSIRYRIPVQTPALAFAGLALAGVAFRRRPPRAGQVTT